MRAQPPLTTFAVPVAHPDTPGGGPLMFSCGGISLATVFSSARDPGAVWISVNETAAIGMCGTHASLPVRVAGSERSAGSEPEASMAGWSYCATG